METQEELNNLAKRINLNQIWESLYFPKYFEIETVRACNAECTMCTIHEWNEKNARMNNDFFYRIADQISRYSHWVERVCLSRDGEPLLDKTLPEKIHALKKSGIEHVTFSTNASLLNEKKSIQLIESGLDDIRFSIDGITKETFESIRKKLNYEQVRDNCLRFINLRNSLGTTPRIQIRMTLQNSNKHEEKAWNSYWNSKVSSGDIVSSKPMHSWGNQLPAFENKNYGVDKYSEIPCISLWSTMAIHYDGRVPLCGCDFNSEFVMGDLNKNTIQEVWQANKFEEIRRLHSSGKRNDIPLCIGCNVWDSEQKKIY